MQQEEAITTEISPLTFDPKCGCTWAHVAGVAELLLAVGELDEADDLLVGAGGIVLSFQYTWPGVGKERHTLTAQRIEGGFFQKTASWIREHDLEDIYLENGQLLVSDFIALVEELTRFGALRQQTGIAA